MHLLTTSLSHLFTSLLCMVHIYAFNLETRLPVIKYGAKGSYFGYAVAAHQIKNEQTSNISEGLILVGAPLGKNLQPNTTRSGALWRCPLTNDVNDCSQVITDGRRGPKGELRVGKVESNQLYPPTASEDKEDQWMGVTVKSQAPGGKVLVCAHRYKVNKTQNILGLGLCYVLMQDLELDRPLNHCEGLPTKNLHEDYGLCQQGTNGMIFEDDNAVIGAAGSLDWRGKIFVSSTSNDFYHRDEGVYDGGGVINQNFSFDENIPKFGYLGMAVTAGYFAGGKTTIFVAGAPRAHEVGQVVLFEKRIGSSVDLTLREYLTIKGEQIASYFGHEVIGADVNGDGLPDLFVAAPFYFTNEVGGAVYMYLNDHKSYLKHAVPVKLTGKPESRFGFSLISLGDLNNDKMEDVAIGAPYEDNGVVYIYLGSPNGLLLEPTQVIKAEMVAPKHLTLNTFGYSLSGGVDLDQNGYPDLVIGAYGNDTVVLLRSRPIVDIKTTIKSPTGFSNFDPAVRNCLITNTNSTNYLPCFHFEICCIIQPRIDGRRGQLLIQYELIAETFNKHREMSRIWFDDMNVRSSHVAKNLTVSTVQYCQNHTAYLKENTQDIQTPIQMKMSFTLINKELKQPAGLNLLSLDDYPILNQLEAVKFFNATFLKDCGHNDICESHLIVLTNLSLTCLNQETREYELSLGEDEKLVMNISIINKGESAYETHLYIKLPEPVTYAKLAAVLEGSKKGYVCGSHDSEIVCKIANPLKQGEIVILQLEFDLQNVNGSQPELEFEVFTNTSSVDLYKESKVISLVHVVEKTMISISGDSAPEEIPDLVNTALKAESAVEFKDEIGNKVTHYYTIMNNGSWPVSGIRVDIEWPYQMFNNKPQGKWLLYLDEYPKIEGSNGRAGNCHIPYEYINPLNLKTRDFVSSNSSFRPLPGDKSTSSSKTNDFGSKLQSNRVRRDTEVTVPVQTYTNKDGTKYRVVKINCLLNSAKCINISCDVDLLESKQFLNIAIKSRLWDATIIEDYSNVDIIEIASRARMHIVETEVRKQNVFGDEACIKTTARGTLRGQQPTAPVPLFVIIAAIIIGLLLFMLLTLLLWKLGFFKRRRPDPTLSGNLEKHRIDEYHDY